MIVNTVLKFENSRIKLNKGFSFLLKRNNLLFNLYITYHLFYNITAIFLLPQFFLSFPIKSIDFIMLIFDIRLIKASE